MTSNDYPYEPKTWSELREWDKKEEEEIRKFEHLRQRKGLAFHAMEKFKSNPIPYLCVPLVGYFIFAGLNALQTGHTYMAIKYLEYRIWAQATGIIAIFGGAFYYQRVERKQLLSEQPYGPYKHSYGQTHPRYDVERSGLLF